MKFLVLGGTVFLGRHIVEAARERGHEVTLFNRGQSNPGLFSNVPAIHGDRTADLSGLEGGRWDAVIDVAGYVPRVVRMSAEVASRVARHYTFISTISVFAGFAARGMDESAPVGSLDDPSTETVDGETYGPLKALCEQAAEAAMPGRTLVIRPGLIVGPHDPSDRFTYWPHRIAEGGEVLAPDDPRYETQLIDVRDLAEWTVRMVEARATGPYNATGPATTLTLDEVMQTCRIVSGSVARFTWVPEKFLRDAGVAPWAELPLWVGGGDEMAGFGAIDCRKATAAGLTFRPLAVTVRDTLAWGATRPPGPLKAGLTREKEAELLERWHALEAGMEAV
ncbi:MAG: epimerase [Anaerolinea sp.]|nr:epimerase [Anaerolinea sp.]